MGIGGLGNWAGLEPGAREANDAAVAKAAQAASSALAKQAEEAENLEGLDGKLWMNFRIREEVFQMVVDQEELTPLDITTIWQNDWNVQAAFKLKFHSPQDTLGP